MCETLKFSDVLDKICKDVGITGDSLDVDENVLAVMLYEVLLGRGKIKSGGVVKRRIMENIDKFNAALVDEMKAKGVDDVQGLLSEDVLAIDNVPKYVRVNSIKTTFLAGLNELKGFAGSDVVVDEHIPSLLMIPASKATGLSSHDGVLSGRLIIQDKASCFPSQILYDEWELIKFRVGSDPADLVDTCAAPGNKTSHLAAQLFRAGVQGTPFQATVFAFDRSVVRAQLLQHRMDAAGAANVLVTNMDILTVDTASDKYRHVRAVLVDPSCSGSGLVRSLERAIEKTSNKSLYGTKCEEAGGRDTDARLDKLRQFQIAVVSKAMSFPAAEAVVYSTCSIHVVRREK